MKNNLIAATRTLATTFPTNTGRLAIAILTLISIGLAKIAYNFRQFKNTIEGAAGRQLLEDVKKGEEALKDGNFKIGALRLAIKNGTDMLRATKQRLTEVKEDLYVKNKGHENDIQTWKNLNEKWKNLNETQSKELTKVKDELTAVKEELTAVKGELTTVKETLYTAGMDHRDEMQSMNWSSQQLRNQITLLQKKLRES